MPESDTAALLRRGRALEVATLAWNVVGLAVLAWSAVAARSVALAGFGLDSMIEIAASVVVLWELAGSSAHRQERALRAIRVAFLALAAYLLAQSAVVLVLRHHPRHSATGIGWTAATAVVMFLLATGKHRTGRRLDNPVLLAESRVTVIDGVLALAVLVGLVLNAALDAWWTDPAAGLVIVYYAAREALAITRQIAEG